MTETKIIGDFTPAMLPRIMRLYRQAGWVGEQDTGEAWLLPALRGSAAVAVAAEGNNIIGIGRAISDGVSDAYIQDVAVDENHRRRGIGRKIIDTLAEELLSRGIDWIALVGEPGTEKFYEKLSGWEKKPGYCFWQYRRK